MTYSHKYDLTKGIPATNYADWQAGHINSWDIYYPYKTNSTGRLAEETAFKIWYMWDGAESTGDVQDTTKRQLFFTNNNNSTFNFQGQYSSILNLYGRRGQAGQLVYFNGDPWKGDTSAIAFTFRSDWTRHQCAYGTSADGGNHIMVVSAPYVVSNYHYHHPIYANPRFMIQSDTTPDGTNEQKEYVAFDHDRINGRLIIGKGGFDFVEYDYTREHKEPTEFLETTNDTSTQIESYAFDDGLYHCRVLIKAITDTDSFVQEYRLSIVVRDGIASITGTPQIIYTGRELSNTWDVIYATSTNNLLINVIGESDTTIEWTSKLEWE